MFRKVIFVVFLLFIRLKTLSLVSKHVLSLLVLCCLMLTAQANQLLVEKVRASSALVCRDDQRHVLWTMDLLGSEHPLFTQPFQREWYLLYGEGSRLTLEAVLDPLMPGHHPYRVNKRGKIDRPKGHDVMAVWIGQSDSRYPEKAWVLWRNLNVPQEGTIRSYSYVSDQVGWKRGSSLKVSGLPAGTPKNFFPKKEDQGRAWLLESDQGKLWKVDHKMRTWRPLGSDTNLESLKANHETRGWPRPSKRLFLSRCDLKGSPWMFFPEKGERFMLKPELHLDEIQKESASKIYFYWDETSNGQALLAEPSVSLSLKGRKSSRRQSSPWQPPEFTFNAKASVIAVVVDDEEVPLAGVKVPLNAIPVWIKAGKQTVQRAVSRFEQTQLALTTQLSLMAQDTLSPQLALSNLLSKANFVLEGTQFEPTGAQFDSTDMLDGPWRYAPFFAETLMEQLQETWSDQARFSFYKAPLRSSPAHQPMRSTLELMAESKSCGLPIWQGALRDHNVTFEIQNGAGEPLASIDLHISGLTDQVWKCLDWKCQETSMVLSKLPEATCLAWHYHGGQKWVAEVLGEDGRSARHQVLYDLLKKRTSSTFTLRFPRLKTGELPPPEMELVWREQGPLLKFTQLEELCRAYRFDSDLTPLHAWETKGEKMEIPLPQSYRDGDVWLFSWGEALAGFARIFQLPEHPLLGITSLDSSSFLSLHQNSKGSTELGLFQQGHYHGVKAQCPSLMLWNRLAYDEAEGRVVLWQNGSTQLSVWSEADESVMKTLDAGAKLRDVKVLRTQQESCLLIATDHDLRWLTFDGALVSSYRRPGFNPKGLTLTDRGVAVLDVRHDHGWVYDFELKTQKITAGWVALKPIKIPLHDQWNWTCDPSAKRIWTLDAIEQSLTRWQWTEDPSWTMRDQDCFHNPNQVPQVIFNHDGLTVMRPRGVERIEF